jgi:hypothetical protein
METVVSELGYVVASRDVSPVGLDKVRKAAESAGFDPAVVKDIKPRNAFIRAARALVRKGVLEEGNHGLLRDKIVDEQDVVFQYSARNISANKAEYFTKAIVRFRKAGETIWVDEDGLSKEEHKKIYDQVVSLFEEAGYTFSSTDFHGLVNRLYAQATRKIMLRDAVYFVPAQFSSLVNKVKKFYEELGFNYYVFTIGAGDLLAKGDIYKAVVDDVKKNIHELTQEVKELQAKGDDALSGCVVKNRFKSAAKDLQHYQEIAKSLKCGLSEVLEDAGQAGKTLSLLAKGAGAIIAAVSSGGCNDPLALVLAGKESGNKHILDLAAKISMPQIQIDKPVSTFKPVQVPRVAVPQIG